MPIIICFYRVYNEEFGVGLFAVKMIFRILVIFNVHVLIG